ncbi:protein ULTRAPETALA 2-like [Nicotiana tabacum]|uniref:Protein ULTRAPETALA 2-like n=2 Tax=Nicotiana TaxID=4085 RepID=A0A1S3ZAD9_TOBAC|nr:protein ULTRAPETALA 2-like isoform X1 [Nicotiana tomentosiformis]XP_016461420.1 PREDICTED: protein ULTRAPETALA 2-like [Nicotiana tabacum]
MFSLYKVADMFTEKELENFMGVLKRGSDYVEIECGCTVTKFGDTNGKLRIFPDGRLEIDCQCYSGCPEVKLSPIEFAKHAGRKTAIQNWKSQIWVNNKEGRRENLWKTCLLKYHTDTFRRPLRGQIIHRDEFIRCTNCNKDRRFLLRTKEECRIYHDAVANKDWKCSDMPHKRISCNDAEERESRKACRACPRTAKCNGCVRCVCFGCSMCKFEDCNCRACVDFLKNI